MEKNVRDKNLFHQVGLISLIVIFLLLQFRASRVLAENLEEGARKEGKVMFYSNIPAPDSQILMDAFQKKYPYIKADFYRGSTIGLLERARTEKKMGRTFADVSSVMGMFVNIYKKEDMVEKYLSPHSRFIPQGFKDPEGFWMAFSTAFYNFTYNTKMISPKDLPKSYDDLLHPRWKKKIGLSSDDVEWFIGMIDFLGEEKARQFLKRLAEQDPIIRAGRNLLSNLLVAGEFPLALGIVHRTLEQQKQGAPIDMIPFHVPTLAAPRMIVIHANAPHPNAARLLFDFILSKDGQSILNLMSRHPVRRDVKVDPAVEKIMQNMLPIKPVDSVLTEGYKKEFDAILRKRK